MKKILLIQVGVGFLHLNRSVMVQLKKYFPDMDVELFDVMPLIRRDYKFLLLNALFVFREYFYDFITFRKSVTEFKYYFLGTTLIFKKFSALVREKAETQQYEFILQTQCMCDASGIKNTPVVIYTDHTSLNNLSYKYAAPYQYLRPGIYVELEKKAYENAALILVMSRNIRDSLISQYGIDRKKVQEVYVSTNTPLPASIDYNKYSNQNIIFVGKDWKRKGGPLLVEAFRKVQQKLPSATLTIVGCNPDINVKNCEVVGDVSLEKVAQRYNKATVFCLPTRREPFGIVFLEAMFNMLPIVTNNMGAAPYLVQSGQNGYLLENDIDDYANVLIELLSDPAKCRAYGEKSFAIARTTYTWENVGELMHRYISRQVLGKKPVRADKVLNTHQASPLESAT